LLLLAAALAIVAGTESGTRWALKTISSLAPIEIDAQGSNGTLLSDLDIPFIRYSDENRSIEISDVRLNVDWSRSSLSGVAIEQLIVNEVALQDLREVPPDATPLEIDMAPLPLAISADKVSVDALVIGEIHVTDIVIEALAIEGRQFQIATAALSLAPVAAEIQELDIDLGGDVPAAATFRWKMAESTISGEGAVSGDLRQLTLQHRLAGDFPATTSGTLALLNRIEPLADVVIEFDGWQYQDFTVGDAVIRLNGTASNYTANLSGNVSSPTTPTVQLQGNLAGNLDEVYDLDIRIDTPLAQGEASGRVAWAPVLAIDVTLATQGMDPSTLAALPQGRIDSRIRVMADSAQQFEVNIIALSGLWNGQPINGHAQASRQDESWRCANCRVQVGNNHIELDGQMLNRRLSGKLQIDADSLQQLWPGLSGSLNGGGTISGSATVPIFSGEFSANAVVFGDWKAGSISLASRNSTAENIDFVVDVAKFSQGDTELGDGRLQLSGEPLAVELFAEWSLGDYAASASGQLNIEDEIVQGSISSASITEPLTGSWEMTDTISLSYGPGTVRIENGHWRNADAQFVHPLIALEGGLLRFDAELSKMPLSPFNPLLPDELRLDGLVDASASVAQAADGWSGNIEWRQPGTVVLFQPGQDDEFRLDLPVAIATATLEGNGAKLVAEVSAEPGINANLQLSVEELATDSAINARLQVDGEQWDWITALIPDIDNVEGRITADIVASGSPASPDFSGDLRWTDGKLAIPALNLPLTDIDVRLAGSPAGDLNIEGKATSGDGPIAISGHLNDVTSPSRSFAVQIRGDNASLLNWPGSRVTASPDLSFAGNTKRIKIDGRIDLDSADIIVRDLPEGAVRPSTDVVVEGREAEVRERTQVSGNVEVVLSDRIHISAFGLDTNVEGQLQFQLSEEREPRAQGELRLVGGVFEAYGQRLEIEQGTMIFAGPLDDPLINVRAVRKIDGVDGTVTAGLHLTGRAQNLKSSVFSDPAMSEAEILSYLVLGRPLSDASAADGSSLSNTAYSLGLRQAALITNQIGQTVGLDELRVSGSNQNTTELVAGKQINSRLYARYAYGVFTRLGHLLLHYKLSESFAIEVGAGETQSMDIMYSIERE
jgi:translocation and assembly module TamB